MITYSTVLIHHIIVMPNCLQFNIFSMKKIVTGSLLDLHWARMN